jgi:hypothetical protein
MPSLCSHTLVSPKQNKRETRKDGMVCYMAREDYFECLHSRKEHAMVTQVMKQEKLNASKENGDTGH